MTSPLPRFWADLKTTDFAQLDAARSIAVLPLAATEQHGPHLPLSVDTALVNGGVASALAHLPAGLPVFFLPTQTVGRSVEHTAFAGTLTLSAATLIQAWVDLGECVARTGIQKLVLLNSHGGNVSTMDIVGRELRARCGMTVAMVNTFALPLPAGGLKVLRLPHVHPLGVQSQHHRGFNLAAVHAKALFVRAKQRLHRSRERQCKSIDHGHCHAATRTQLAPDNVHGRYIAAVRIEQHQLLNAGARHAFAQVYPGLNQRGRTQRQRAGKGRVLHAAAHRLRRQKKHRQASRQMRQRMGYHAIDQVGVHTQRQVRAMLLSGGQRQHGDAARRVKLRKICGVEVGPKAGQKGSHG